jgi:tryptophan halogenase
MEIKWVHSERTARDAGWQWQIPLQHRDGNGYIYSGEFCTDEAAHVLLRGTLAGRPLSEPVALRFRPGRRKAAWNKNVLTLRLAVGFLEPLAATSIHLIQRGIAMLLKFFSDRDFSPADIARYNWTLESDFSSVRDRASVRESVEAMPRHWEFIQSGCGTSPRRSRSGPQEAL